MDAAAEFDRMAEIGRELGFGVDEIEAIRSQVDPHQSESPAAEG